jgi:hypothetical protein
MVCVKGNKYAFFVKFGETRKVPLFEEIENSVEVFARVLRFPPTFTLAAWLCEL